MLALYHGPQPGGGGYSVSSPSRSRLQICTNIASAELYYADSEGTCYSSRVMYTSDHPELSTGDSPSLGYPSHFAYILRAPGERSQWAPPTPPSPSPKVEPLIPEQPIRYIEYGSSAPKDVPASHRPNSFLGMAGVNKQVGSDVANAAMR